MRTRDQFEEVPFPGSVENADAGVRGAECGKCGVWKMRGVENVEQITIFHFNFRRKAEKQCVNN